jgi:hypothetical protein
MGRFAVVEAYGLARATADPDVIAVLPYPTTALLVDIAGKESTLRRRYNLYLDVVTVATTPENYESRLTALYPSCWRHLRLFVLEPDDLALSKLERNFERDRTDVQHLARSGYLQASILLKRYHQEMRPYVIDNLSWHDQTLAMWVEAFLQDSDVLT